MERKDYTPSVLHSDMIRFQGYLVSQKPDRQIGVDCVKDTYANLD